MDDLYTILIDPKLDGQWKLYNHTFYTTAEAALSIVKELNKFLYLQYKVVKVSFNDLDYA